MIFVVMAVAPFIAYQNLWVQTHEDIHEAIFTSYNISSNKTINYGSSPSGIVEPDNKPLPECVGYSIAALQSATELYQYQTRSVFVVFYVMFIGMMFLALTKND